jgi:hypothetical protein
MAVTNPYATAADLQIYLNNLGGMVITLGTGSAPTTAQAEGFLDQVAAEINAVLTATGYGTVPASGANDLLFLRRYVAQKAAAMVYHAGMQFDVTPEKVKRWEQEYDQLLERLISKQQQLIDQRPRSTLRVIHVGRYVED